MRCCAQQVHVHLLRCVWGKRSACSICFGGNIVDSVRLECLGGLESWKWEWKQPNNNRFIGYEVDDVIKTVAPQGLHSRKLWTHSNSKISPHLIIVRVRVSSFFPLQNIKHKTLGGGCRKDCQVIVGLWQSHQGKRCSEVVWHCLPLCRKSWLLWGYPFKILPRADPT